MSDAIFGRKKALLDRKRRNAGQDVAAVLDVADDRVVDLHLQKQIVNVGFHILCLGNDGDFAR